MWLAPRSACPETEPHIAFPAAARDRICVASYPFRNFIRGSGAQPGSNPPIDLKDFAAHVKERFQVNKIEPWTGHFPNPDLKYLDQFRSALDKSDCQVANIAVDGDDSPYSPDPAERARVVAHSNRWIDVAVILGAPGIRTNMPAAKDGRPDPVRTAGTLRQVVDYAAGKNVVISLENDNPVSEDPFFIVQVIEQVQSPWLHALPDFANTLAHRDAQYAYRGIDAMFAHAYCICHVKETEVNEAGKAVHVDLPRTFGYLKQHDYRGYLSMEWDSPGDPYAGTADLIKKTLRYL
jgi:sugar phosphate isomerase/epimerase